MLDYPRRVFDGILDWYKNADAKAQIILTLDGAFIAFLTSSVFMEQKRLGEIIASFGWETWLLLSMMCFSLTGSIASAIVCLWSRIYSRKELDEILQKTAVDIDNYKSYPPSILLFFQFLSRLDKKQLAERLLRVDDGFEIEALAHEIPVLSKNVMAKHRWVNRGFFLAGASLVLFLAVSMSYVIRIAK